MRFKAHTQHQAVYEKEPDAVVATPELVWVLPCRRSWLG
jgi:hypothetical protein